MKPRESKRRERILLNVLPAALVLALYAFLFALPAQRQYQQVRNRLQAVQNVAVDQSVAKQSQENLQLAEAGMSRLQEQIKLDREQIAFLGRQWNRDDARLSTVQQVTELLQQFNLSIVRQDFEEQPLLPAYLKKLEDIVTRFTDSEETPEYWQIELAGGYTDMMSFLHQIKASGLRTFALTLTMQASASNDGVHTWSVVFVV